MLYDLESVNPRFGIGSEKWEEIKNNPLIDEKVIPFSVADMEFKLATEITEGLKSFIDNNVLGYSGSSEKYKKIVCKWQREKHNFDVDENWLVETHSVVNAFFNAVKAFTKKHEGVILFTPVYFPMYKAIEINQRKLIDVPLINNGITYDIDWDLFEKKAKEKNTKMLILCNPHNPCGRIWNESELRKISKICLENNVFVVSDEIHGDLVMPGFKHVSYGTMSKKALNEAIICTAPSKTFNLAGMQLSNIFIPNEKYRKMFKLEKETDADTACGILSYEACNLAYEFGEKWLEEVINIIDINRKTIVDFMQEYFPQIKITQLQATYLLWLDLRAFKLNDKELEKCNREKACLYFDEGYVFGKAGSGFERWNLACPTKYIKWALERFYLTYREFSYK